VPLRPYLFHSGGHQSFLHYMCEDFDAFLPLYHNIKIVWVGDQTKTVKKYYTPTPPLRGSTNRRFLCQSGGHHFLIDIKGSEA
jgi:hypothetical protein